MDGSSRPRAPQPAPPDRGYSFTDWQTANPTAPPPGDKLDAELDRTNQAVEDVINWVSTSLNSDGSLVEPPVGEPPPETGAVALAEDWADVSVAWAEHMPDTIPPNILATNAITGDHWSSRWWANRAAQIVQGQIKVPVWLPEGQPDGVTDNSEALQAALDAAAGCSDPAGEDPLGGVDNAMRAAAPGQWTLVIPAAPAPYIVGKSLYVPSNSHIVIEHGATLKLAPQTHDHMFLLCNFAHHVLIELYGTLDGNSSQQFFKQNSPGVSPPSTDMPPTSISGGITTDTIWGGPARNPVVQGGICSHVKIIGDRNGLITNFQNQAVGLAGATNCEVSDISLTNSAFHAGSVGVSGWRNFPYDPAAGTPLTFTGTFVAATGVVTLTTNVPHCMVPGEEFITETLTGTGGFNAATGKLFITLAGTAGNTIVYAATGGGVGTDGSITGGRITNWFYQQAAIVSGTYVPATGVITVTTTAPHQLVYGQTISSNITGGTVATIATGIFQLLDVTDGAGAPPISGTKVTTLRYRTTRTGTTENIVSGVYDSPSGNVTLTTDAPHGLSPGDVVTVSSTGSGFLQTLNTEQVCITGTLGTTIKYTTLSGLTGITISGGTVYGGPTLSITGGTIGVSTKCWNSGFDNCFMDQIRDIGPCIYGGGVGCYIRNSEITRNLGSGPFLFSDANSGRCVDCEISGNYIHDNLGAGVGTVNFGTGNIPHTGTRIFNNYITGNRGGAGFDSCDGLECADNYFYKNRAVGLNTYGSVGEITVGPGANRVRITGNTLRDPCLISTTMAGTTLTQVVSGTYNNATGAVSLTTAIPNNLYSNAYFTLSATTGTGAHTSIEGRYVAEASTGPTILNFHAPAGLGTITITGGQLVPNGFGIVTHGADRLYIADNFIADYQSPPTMLAAIGGTWGIQGVCTGNYYGPRINTGGNFPADMSAGGMQGNNFDVVTGFTNGTTLHQPFSNDSAERFAPLGLQVGYNRSAGRGESNIYVGAGNGSPGGFDFIKVIGISVQAPSSYATATAIVTLTTRTPHGLTVGSRFNLSLVLGTDSIGFTDGRDVQKLDGNWIATADNAGTSGTTINFVLTQNVAGVPTPYMGLDILTITAGAINASALDSGVIDTSVGLPVAVSNSGTLGVTTGGSLLSVDGYANTRLSGALVHGAIQTATLANGGTVTVPQNTSFMLVNNSSSIATGSLVLPAPAASSFQTIGSQLDVRFQNPVGALTVTAATGAAVAGPPTAVLSAGAAFRFIQGGPGAANTWLPCIPDVSGTPPVGGPYLPLSGGAVTGPLTVNGLLTATAGLTASGGGTFSGTFSGSPLWSAAHTFNAGFSVLNLTATFGAGLSAGTNSVGVLSPSFNAPGNTFTGTSNTLPPRLNLNWNLAGTIAGQSYCNYLTVSADSADARLGANGGLFDLGIVHNVTGTATVNGGRGLMWGQLNVGALTNPALEMLGVAAMCVATGDTNGAFLQPFSFQVGVTPAGKVGNTVGEIGLKCQAGSSVVVKGFIKLTYNPADAVAGSTSDYGINIASANAAGVSPGCGIFLAVGSTGQGFPMNPTTGTVVGTIAQQYVGASGKTAHIIPPQCFAGIDFAQIDFTQASGVAFRSPAFSVDGGGQISTGNATITRNATGIAIDIPNQIVTAAVVAAGGGGGGSGTNDYYVGDILFGGGGLYRVATVTAGAVATVTILVPGSAASPPANPVATTGGSGVNCTLTLTWAARNTLALQPSGGATTFGGPVTLPSSAPFMVTATGGTAAHSLQDRFGYILTVKDFGAVGNGVTDDTAAINAAIAAQGSGLLYFPEGTYIISSTLTLPSGQRWEGASKLSSVLQWTGGNSVDIVNTAVIVDQGGIQDIGINAGTATGVTLLHLRNAKQGTYRSLYLDGNGGAGNVALFLEAGAASTVGNTCHNAFYHVIGRNCAKGIVFLGTSASVSTDNSFFHLDMSSTSGITGFIGVEFQRWCDSNQFYFARITLNGPNGTCVLCNSLDPTGTPSVYNEVFHGLMCDNIGSVPSATGFKLNASQGIYATGVFISPAPYTGKFVDADPVQARSYYISTTNADLPGTPINMQVYQHWFGDTPEAQLNVPGFARTTGAVAPAAIGAANRLYATPIFLNSFYTLKTLSINVTTGNGTSAWNARLGLYADNGFHKPGTLVANTDTGVLSIAQSATGAVTSAVLNAGAGVLLTRGYYWLAVVVDIIGAQVTSAGPTGPDDTVNTAGSLAVTVGKLGAGLYGALTFGALPGPFPTVTQSPGSDVPAVIMGF